jgi:large subunit ribosomal protein L10
MNREEKAKIIAEVKEKLSRARGLVLTDFTRMTVAEVNELRREFRKSGVDYKVVKNTLARIAMSDVGGFDELMRYLEGPTAIAFGYDDPVVPAKLIKKFMDKNKIDRPKVKALVLEGIVYDSSKLDEIAKLPSRDEIISGVIGSITSPISGVVNVINAVLRDITLVLDAITKKLEERKS